MENKSNSSLIMALHDEFYGKSEKSQVKKYSESTQTLYSDKNLYEQNKKEDKKIVVVQTEAYKRILFGIQHYVITNNKDFVPDEEICIIEDNSNMSRYVFRTISAIETSIENKGLIDGFIILSI